MVGTRSRAIRRGASRSSFSVSPMAPYACPADMAFIRVYGRATPDRAGARPYHGGKSVPGVPLRSTPGFSPVAPSGLPKFSRSILERSIAICALSSSLELYTYWRLVIDFATDLGLGSFVTPLCLGKLRDSFNRPKKNAESSTNNPEQLLRKMKDLP